MTCYDSKMAYHFENIEMAYLDYFQPLLHTINLYNTQTIKVDAK